MIHSTNKLDEYIGYVKTRRGYFNLVTEGDSWFGYPKSGLALGHTGTNIIDHIERSPLKPNVLRLEFSGDEAVAIMAQEQRHKLYQVFHGLRQKEYRRKASSRVSYIPSFILFSAGGNDIVGDADLPLLLRDWNKVRHRLQAAGQDVDLEAMDEHSPAGRRKLEVLARACLREKHLQLRIQQIELAYQELIYFRDYFFCEQPNDPSATRPWILTHGYDYFVPRDVSSRFFGYKPGPWVINHLRDSHIEERRECGGDPANAKLQRAIARFLIDQLNARLDALAGSNPFFHKVETVGLLQEDEWRDEIHPTPEGFAKIAEAFVTAMKHLGRP